MKLGRLKEARASLEVAKHLAVAVGSGGAGHDSYVDVAGVLVDLGAVKMMQGEWDEAQKDLSRALYM